MRGFLRQPLVHFFVLGLAIFGLSAAFDDGSDNLAKPAIVVSTQDAQWLSNQYQATWRRPPSEAELSALIDDFVREEIYVREALALGLDQGDTIVRRRLRQKMEFITEAGAEAATATDDVLQAHLEANEARFARPPRVAFAQVLLPDASEVTEEEIRVALMDGADPHGIASSSLLPTAVPPSPPQSVDAVFGVTFFDRVSELEIGEWSGPIQSGFGLHLVRLDSLESSIVPPLAEIRERVELDWRANMARDLRQQRFEELKARYAIETPDPSLVLSQ